MQPRSYRLRSHLGGLIAALLIGGGVLMVAPGSASAGGVAPGNITCQAGGGFTTNPGLSASGTLGKKLDVTLITTLSGCKSESGAPVPKMPESVTNKTVKLPPDPCLCSKKMETVGKASDFAELLKSAMVKQKIVWGPGVKSTKAIDKVALNPQPLPPGQCAEACEATLQFKSVTSSSGPFALTEFLDPASTQDLNKLIAGTGSPVSTFSFDSTTGSATEGPTVLTYGSAGGADVQVGDVLTVPTFTIPAFCTGGNIEGVVTSNPPAPGTAEVSVTDAALTGCSLNIAGPIPVSFTATINNLPYQLSVSDSSGDPFSLSTVTMTADFGGGSTCQYAASGLSGSYSNATNTGTTSGGEFDLTAPVFFCPPTISSVSSSVGPIEDASQPGSPAVFVN